MNKIKEYYTKENFKNKFFEYIKTLNPKNSLKETEISPKQLKIKQMQNFIQERQKKRTLIQSNFDFSIPVYVLDEIINNNYNSINYMLHLSSMTGSLSKENAKILQKYVLNKKNS